MKPLPFFYTATGMVWLSFACVLGAAINLANCIAYIAFHNSDSDTVGAIVFGLAVPLYLWMATRFWPKPFDWAVDRLFKATNEWRKNPTEETKQRAFAAIDECERLRTKSTSTP